MHFLLYLDSMDSNDYNAMEKYVHDKVSISPSTYKAINFQLKAQKLIYISCCVMCVHVATVNWEIFR